MTTGSDGKTYEMLCLPVTQLNSWLNSISCNKVSLRTRPKLLDFQKHCHIALDQYFKGGISREEAEAMQRTIDDLRAQLAEKDRIIAEKDRFINTTLAEHGERISRLEGPVSVEAKTNLRLIRSGG